MPVATVTVLTATPNPATAFDQVELLATVSESAATGAVTFYDGTTVLGVSDLEGGSPNVARLDWYGLVGTHSLTAVYAGMVIDGGAA